MNEGKIWDPDAFAANGMLEFTNRWLSAPLTLYPDPWAAGIAGAYGNR